MEKICENCGRMFAKRPRNSLDQWLDRAYCSLECSNGARGNEPPHLYFWSHVEKMGEDECWPWLGTVDERGYGRVHYKASKIKAHRVSFEMVNGHIQDGNIICHKCDNPNCVNPNHLFEGTSKDNAQDMVSKGRQNPKSLLSLRPGKKGFYGAGPKSNKELKNAE